jgi:hypothetical protein
MPPTGVVTRLRTAVLVLIVALAAALLTGATASAATCPTGWGSLAKELAPLGQAPVQGVRTGVDGCWDRVVFDLNGSPAGYRVEYVDTVYSEGQGAPLYVPGGARLSVNLHHPAGNLPYGVNQKAANVDGYPVLRSITYGGSFEGHTQYGVGVRARLPFRVFTLANPGRIVIDVARSW